MTLTLSHAIALITSSDPKNDRFGTGFIVRRTGDFAYVVTCAHVIRDVGVEMICVEDVPGHLEVTGEDLGLDLAVIRVEGLVRQMDTVFPIVETGGVGGEFVTEGYQVFDRRAQTRMKRTLQGAIAQQIEITASPPHNPVRALEMHLDEGNVQEGYSGSPVVDPQTEQVVGVISHRLQDGVGVAIAIEELNRIWQPIERHQLKETLMQLGYRPQARLFRKLIEQNPIGAYLVHGPTEQYGQQWLVNRLLQQYVPTSLTAKKIRIELDRVGRRNDVDAMWVELALELKCDRNTPPKEIAKRALHWWRTQDLILAIYDVDCLSEELLNHLIQEFWLPLANEAEGLLTQGNARKLLMFLVDYEAVTIRRNVPFTEPIDADSSFSFPFKSPQNQKFSEDEIEDWIDSHYRLLPKEMTKQTDKTVHEMYEESEEGIPEWTFVEICKRCGYDWRTESAGWCSI